MQLPRAQLVVLIFLFSFATLSAQKVNHNLVFSLKEFNYSVEINKKLKAYGYNPSNHFNTSDEAIYYFKKALEWAIKNGTRMQIIQAKQNVLGIYVHIKNNIEVITRIKDLLKYDEVYETFIVRDLHYILKTSFKYIFPRKWSQ